MSMHRLEFPLPPHAIFVADFPTVYKKYLKPKGLDLVVFSWDYNNMIIYDSCMDENGNSSN